MFEAALRDAQARFEDGWRPKSLLSRDNLKLRKADALGWKGYGLSLAPADISGFQMCASSSPQCVKHCIFTSGRAAPHFQITHNSIWMGRIFRTIWFMRDRKGFIERLLRELDRIQGPQTAVRLNVFSDWMWERTFPEIFWAFPQISFYDYTKHFKRMFRENPPKNYHLTFSLNEQNVHQARQVLSAGKNVAAVVSAKSGTLLGYPIVDGDEHDLRFLDPARVVVGLKAKGSLRSEPFGGMIYDPDPLLAEAV